MTTYIIFNSLILLILIATICWLVYIIFGKRQLSPVPTVKDTSAGWKVYAGLILTLIFVVVGLSAPFFLTRRAINADFNFMTTGQIGDTIGGLSSPFLGIAGIIMTGLAFYVQYKANQQQREQFLAEQAENKRLLQQQIDHQNDQTQLSQFESQFYEMLKLHRENIQEMEITGYDFKEEGLNLERFEKVTNGRKVFVVMKTEFECILGIYKHVKGSLSRKGFTQCYEVFFSGLDSFSSKHSEEKEFIKILWDAKIQHENPPRSRIWSNKSRKEFGPFAHLYFNYKPFSGHASRLGHYYRHLYLAVKSVANSEVVTKYEDRMKYFALLRAQLSNHEQIMLFYNWLSGFGADWEDDNHSYFTEYKMIHNLWHDNLFQDILISQEVNSLRTKPVSLRQGKMFEID